MLKSFFIVGAICLGLAANADAGLRALEIGTNSNRAPAAMLQSSSVTLDQAVAMMEAKYKARAMRANTVEEDGRKIHYIRLITADRARVFEVRVEAATGREL